jgi:uncharacterized protein YkwD
MGTEIILVVLSVGVFISVVKYLSNSRKTNIITSTDSNQKDIEYQYSELELEILELINNYRIGVGLNKLTPVNYISYKSEEHTNYMISNNVVNHNNFVSRSENLISVLTAKRVGENVAYNYSKAQSVLNGWLNSPTHKENIEGDYTHFGISIRKNTDGKNYFTNIFVKIY